MKHIMIASVLSIASLCSTHLMAYSSPVLSQQMSILTSSFSSFNKAKTQHEALTALMQMKQASNVSKAELPANLKHLPSNAPQVLHYQLLYNRMNNHIDTAITLVKAGKLDEAKQISKEINLIKSQGHSTYQ